MRHHFGDSLDRDGDYWTVVPNRERYAYRINEVPTGSRDILVATIGKQDENWRRALTFPNLEELTLHEPTLEQLNAATELGGLKRLRITHARPKNIEFISKFTNLEELVLEYVSGFDDLSPIGSLNNLRALHMENLRRVSDFSGLREAKTLRYLAIHGTLDWKQPIDDFEFIRGLTSLELLALWQFLCRAHYPATLPLLSLPKLKQLRAHSSYLKTEECALLEVGLNGIEGANWGPYETRAFRYHELSQNNIRAHLPDDVIRANHPDVRILYDGRREVEDPDSRWFLFTGLSAGQIKCSSKLAHKRCEEKSAQYEALKHRARILLSKTAF
jgi:hypothetical protein